MKIEIDISGQVKSGHPKMQTPIMLCFKARGIHTAPPGNYYNLDNHLRYLNFMVKPK